MKKHKLLIFTAVLAFFSLSVAAQDDSHESRREKYRTEKIAFLTSHLNLTPAEAEKFWPVYNQMDNERWEIQKARRELESKVREAQESLSEKEVIKLTRDYAGSLQEEGNLNAQYNEKFLKILPPQKVLGLYKAENEFRMHMFQMYRDRSNNENKDKK
jgi:hypothetical protein